jgi:hypothetical protein
MRSFRSLSGEDDRMGGRIDVEVDDVFEFLGDPTPVALKGTAQ